MIARRALAGLGAGLLATGRATAQRRAGDWPSRPVRVVVPFAPGGPGELLRPLFAHLQSAFGQPFVYDYRPGATGSIGTAVAARAPPDGATLLLSSLSSHVLAPLVLPAAGYDPLRDFTPVTLLVTTPLVLVVHPAVPAPNLAALLAHARAHPGRVSYASPGLGSAGHLTTEMLAQRVGLDLLHVPFAGPGPALTAVVAGQVHAFFDTLGNAAAMLAEGRVRAVALGAAARSPAAPEVPTFAEAGLPGFVSGIWLGLHLPAGAPAAIAGALNRETRRFMTSAEMRERMRGLAFEVADEPAEALSDRIASDLAGFAEVVRRAGIRAG